MSSNSNNNTPPTTQGGGDYPPNPDIHEQVKQILEGVGPVDAEGRFLNQPEPVQEQEEQPEQAGGSPVVSFLPVIGATLRVQRPDGGITSQEITGEEFNAVLVGLARSVAQAGNLEELTRQVQRTACDLSHHKARAKHVAINQQAQLQDHDIRLDDLERAVAERLYLPQGQGRQSQQSWWAGLWRRLTGRPAQSEGWEEWGTEECPVIEDTPADYYGSRFAEKGRR